MLKGKRHTKQHNNNKKKKKYVPSYSINDSFILIFIIIHININLFNVCFYHVYKVR